MTLFEWFCDWILELFWQCGILLLSFYETFFGYLKIMSNFTWSKQYSKTEKSTKLLQLHFIHGCWHLGFFNTWRFGRLETDWSVKNLTLDLTSYSISIDVYLCYIVTVSFICGGNRKKPLTCHKSVTKIFHIMLYWINLFGVTLTSIDML
jgi:hypothetical protein